MAVEQKVPLDHASSPKAEVTSIDKAFQITGTKSTSAIERMSPADGTRKGSLGSQLANIGSEGRSSKIEDANPMKEIGGSTITPRNIVLTISKPSEDRDDIQKSLEASHPFAADGTFQVWLDVNVELFLTFASNFFRKFSFVAGIFNIEEVHSENLYQTRRWLEESSWILEIFANIYDAAFLISCGIKNIGFNISWRYEQTMKWLVEL